MDEVRISIILIFLCFIGLIIFGLILQRIFSNRFKFKDDIDLRKDARIKRREKATDIILGKLKLEEDELLDFIAEMLLDCKYDRDSKADKNVLQKNAELLDKLFNKMTNKKVGDL